jgi:hypothetical protein
VRARSRRQGASHRHVGRPKAADVQAELASVQRSANHGKTPLPNAALGRTITEPSRPSGKRGRTPTPLADQVFACTYKIYSTFSARRFGCDLRDALDRGLMSMPMHPNKLCTFLEDAALTTLLHEMIVRSSLPLRSIETTFAPDSTGFSTSLANSPQVLPSGYLRCRIAISSISLGKWRS